MREKKNEERQRRIHRLAHLGQECCSALSYLTFLSLIGCFLKTPRHKINSYNVAKTKGLNHGNKNPITSNLRIKLSGK